MSRDEDLFDAYLDLALAGQAVEPDAFLAEHGGPDAVSAETRQRLTSIHRQVVERGVGADATGTTARDLGDALVAEATGSSGHGTTSGALDPGLLAGRLEAGRVLGDYRLLELIGGGGMGIVWLAEQVSLGRRVALKLIRPELVASPSSVERFRREARAVARLNHPNAVALYEHGVVDGLAFMVLEWIDGRGMDECVAAARERGEPLSAQQVLGWGRQLALALQAAHEAGLVHRDVKPSNVRIDGSGRARLLDFGVVRLLDTAVPTLTGAFAGSPPYAAPEQISGEADDIEPRTDVYALGALLYEGLTGHVPFEGTVTEQVFHRILTEEPRSPRLLRPELPRDVALVVLKCLEKSPRRRYASARALADDLEALLDLRPVAARAPDPWQRVRRWGRRRPLLAGAALTTLLTLLLLAGWRLSEQRAAEQQRAEQLALALRDAEDAVTDFIRLIDQQSEQVSDTLKTRSELHAQWFPPEARPAIEADLRDLAGRVQRHEEAFQVGLDALGRAERANVTGDTAAAESVRRLRARLHATQYEVNLTRGQFERAVVMADLVARYDVEGEFAELLEPERVVRLAVEPADAELYAFRFVEHADLVEGGEPRLVPTPIGPASLPITPGTWVLEALEDSGDLRRGDLVWAIDDMPIEGLLASPGGSGQLSRGDRLLTVDGAGVTDLHDVRQRARRRPDGSRHQFVFDSAGDHRETWAQDLEALGAPVLPAAELAGWPGMGLQVLRDGESLELVSRGACRFRTTAAPLLLHPDNDLRVGGERSVQVPDGPLLLYYRHPERDPRRVLLVIHPDRRDELFVVRGLPRGATPEGFRPIDASLSSGSLNVGRPLFMAEREVTAAEYLAFLNDPATLAEVDAASRPLRFPRSVNDQGQGGSWRRGADGRYSLPPDVSPDHPISGISWEDAQAYVGWLSERAAAAGGAERYRLPTGHEWIFASGAGTGRDYPFGRTFRSWWAKSCFSRPAAYPEPVMSFPVDESIFGLFDMAGSVSEWCSDWWVESSDRRRYAGGSWPYSEDGTHFRCWGANGGFADVGYVTVGLRLVRVDPVLEALVP